MQNDSLLEWILSAAVFIVVLIAFLIDRILGWRVLGIAVAGSGIYAIAKRRIPYGIEGEPPKGYLTGTSAVIVGIVILALGLLLAWAPKDFDDFMSAINGN
jgi:Na+/H+ antiporter NhaD/arsenite permease-like protein